MATSIKMKNPKTGLLKDGFYGFSWTTLFFGGFPALFRGDFLTFIGLFAVLIILGMLTMGIGAFVASIAWAFMYNGSYTKKLIEKGYKFDASEREIKLALKALGIVDQGEESLLFGSEGKINKAKFSGPPDLSSDSYRIYLGKKYKIEKNSTFEKFTVGENVFDRLDDAVYYCHALEQPEAEEPLKTDQHYIGDTKWKYRMLTEGQVEVTNIYGGVTVYRTLEEAKAQLTWWK